MATVEPGPWGLPCLRLRAGWLFWTQEYVEKQMSSCPMPHPWIPSMSSEVFGVVLWSGILCVDQANLGLAVISLPQPSKCCHGSHVLLSGFVPSSLVGALW